MSDAEWDADDFEPTLVARKPVTDKWDGEDEDDDIKDSWDKESEDEDDKSGSKDSEGGTAVQVKKKKKMSEIIAEREAIKAAEHEAKSMLDKEQAFAESSEGKAQEKLRLLQLEEENNLELAKDMLGVSSGSSGVDAMDPVSKEDFASFDKALVEKISSYSASPQYNDFVEGFIRNLCAEMTSTTIKKIRLTMDALHSAKLKEEKAAKNKKKPTVKMDLRRDLYADDGTYEMDDFM
eukprot:TRINITY_DN288_c0_g1_i2.p1 TRINITY_DN288_c0_g1~~TRINITY_DN288_c0_g1_i2.p1  ORF type:complete len:236 (-),score=76.00 TRINITY_DN288_c0_g1_i2:555-1262(-)